MAVGNHNIYMHMKCISTNTNRKLHVRQRNTITHNAKEGDPTIKITHKGVRATRRRHVS